jgi:hypothetical protein
MFTGQQNGRRVFAHALRSPSAKKGRRASLLSEVLPVLPSGASLSRSSLAGRSFAYQSGESPMKRFIRNNGPTRRRKFQKAHFDKAESVVHKMDGLQRLAERDERNALDPRTPLQIFLGEPPPFRSALASQPRPQSFTEEDARTAWVAATAISAALRKVLA